MENNTSPSTTQQEPTHTSRRDFWTALAVVVIRLVVGITFIFSGAVKLIDPAGTLYKIEDYLAVINLTAPYTLTLYLAIFLALAELILGINTLLGSYRKATPILLLIFMAAMTPLTLYLAIANPIHDCGCFGDALHLTNWQTFGKNTILLALILLLLRYNLRVRSLFHRDVQSLTVLYTALWGLIIAWIGTNYQPILDFRPYRLGTDIPAAIYGENLPETEYLFTYERDGKQQTFTLDSLPDEADGWTFVERTEITPQPDRTNTPAIDHFAIYDGNDDITEQILDTEGYTFIMLSPDIENADDDEVNKINELHDYCIEYGYPFYAVTSSSPRAAAQWIDNTGGEYRFLFMDQTTIRTIARSNPYVLILKDGIIYHKSSIAMLPDESVLTQPFHQIPRLSEQGKYNPTTRTWVLIATLTLPLLFMLLTERLVLFLVRYFQNLYRKSRKKRKKTL